MIKADVRLQGLRILVAEDEFLLADNLQKELEAARAIVLGPVATLTDALALIEAELHIDGAILDANLGRNRVSGGRTPGWARRADCFHHWV